MTMHHLPSVTKSIEESLTSADVPAEWLTMTGDHVVAIADRPLRDQIIAAQNAHRAERVAKKASGSPRVFYPTYGPQDEEERQFHDNWRQEQLAVSRRNSLKEFAEANLDNPAPEQEHAWRFLRDWALAPDTSMLYLWGFTGAGKTHASCAVALTIAADQSVPRLLHWMDFCWDDDPEVSAIRKRRVQAALDAPVVIIDDLFRTNPTAKNCDSVAVFLAERAGRITVISSNIAPLDRPDGDEYCGTHPVALRLMDRLMAATRVEMNWPSMRGRI